MNTVDNGTFMYAKHGKLVKLVNADASGTKASTKQLESRLDIIQGHAFGDHLKSRRGTVYHCIIMWALELGNFEGKV